MRIRQARMAFAMIVSVIALTAPEAMAVTPEAHPLTSATAASGTSLFTTASGLTITCTSGSGSGKATTATTGVGSYLLHGCKNNLGLTCTSTGQPAGTITLETVTLHLVYLDENHTVPGVLATPPASGVFAKFACFGVAVEVKGNGVLGRITSPKCGEKSTSGTVTTETAAHGTQKYLQVEETGTQYDMTVKIGAGAFETAATSWTVSGASPVPVTLTCPEQK